MRTFILPPSGLPVAPSVLLKKKEREREDRDRVGTEGEILED